MTLPGDILIAPVNYDEKLTTAIDRLVETRKALTVAEADAQKAQEECMRVFQACGCETRMVVIRKTAKNYRIERGGVYAADADALSIVERDCTEKILW